MSVLCLITDKKKEKRWNSVINQIISQSMNFYTFQLYHYINEMFYQKIYIYCISDYKW